MSELKILYLRLWKLGPFGLLLLATGGCVRVDDSAPTSASTVAVAPVLHFTTASGITMIAVPGGTFEMGCGDGPDEERPVHQVTVSPFAMDVTEVTQAEFAKLELPNPSQFKDPQRPADQVRWREAALFCNERSYAEGLDMCYDPDTLGCDFSANGYRLPTEAEWEYAARAGGAMPAESPNGAEKTLAGNACYAGSSSARTARVGEQRPNPWGFADMQGNVFEWCQDIYAVDYYAQSEGQDPRGPATGKLRVLRGGSWNSDAPRCRTTARKGDIPGIVDACVAHNTYGFRCVRRLSEEESGKLQDLQAESSVGGPAE